MPPADTSSVASLRESLRGLLLALSAVLLLSACADPAHRVASGPSTAPSGATVAPIEPSRSPDAGSSIEALLVDGTIDIGTGRATINPAFPAPLPAGSQILPPNPGGELELRLLGPTGELLHSVAFSAVVGEQDCGEGGCEPAREASFAVTVPNPESLHEIAVFRGDQKVGGLKASPSTPTVIIDAPTGLESGRARISWQAADADGDALQYRVLYSADSGGTWELVGWSQRETSLLLDSRSLEGSEHGVLMVQASDGLNVAIATTDVFEVPNQPPIVYLSSSPNATISGTGVLVVEVMVYDVEDGQLQDDSIVWSSDRDGVLGTGARLDVLPGSLSVGRHLVTVTATDSAGGTTSESFVIRVSP
jgi:hypothetical protein